MDMSNVKFYLSEKGSKGVGNDRTTDRTKMEFCQNNGSLGIYTKTSVSLMALGVRKIDFCRQDFTNFTKISSRVEKFALQDLAREILFEKVNRGNKWSYVHRVNYCLRSMVSLEDGVEIYYNSSRQTAQYGNLQRCSSVWTCPVCSATISESRRNELKDGLNNWVSSGGSVYLVTLTNSHNVGDRLNLLLDGQKRAFKHFWAKTKVKKMISGKDNFLGCVGRITATEVTFGDNGWHPHYHVLMFFKSSINIQALQSFLAIEWQDSCIKSGLKAPNLIHGVDVRDGQYASQYVSKWGLDYEMTKGHSKKGKDGGLTPFDLLRNAKDNEKYKFLFKEFANAFKGKRQLVWTDGLKTLLGINQKTDEQIILETDKSSDFVANLTQQFWAIILFYKQRAKVLELAEYDYMNNSNNLDVFLLELLEYFRQNEYDLSHGMKGEILQQRKLE